MCAPEPAANGTDVVAVEPGPLPAVKILDQYVKDLAVEISGAELHRVAMDLAATFDEIETEKKQQEQQKTSMRERLAALDLKQHNLAKALRRGTETRPIDVQLVAYYEDGLAIEQRTDTYEELSRRPLRDEERQLPLDAGVAALAAEALVQHSDD